MRVETAGFPRRERGAGSGALHSRDGTSSRPRDAPAPRAPATPAGAPPRAAGAAGPGPPPSSSARRFARGRSRRRRRVPPGSRAPDTTSRSINARAVRWRAAAACGRPEARSQCARVQPADKAKRSKTSNHLLSCETSSSFKPWRGGWGGAGLAGGGLLFRHSFFSLFLPRIVAVVLPILA